MWNIHLNTLTRTKITAKEVAKDKVLFKVIPTGCIVCVHGVLSIWNNQLSEANEISVVETLQSEGLQVDHIKSIETSLNGDVIVTAGSVILLASPQEVTVVGQVDSEIVGLSKSPDEEVFVLVTDSRSLILMTTDFEPLNEVPLDPEDSTYRGELSPVNVGWGSKETQFHGKAGKAAAKITTTKLSPLEPDDDEKVKIVWKGDGQNFAVSYFTEENSMRIRRIRVFDRLGALQSTVEDVSGLGHSLAWKPSGSLLASTIRHPSKYLVQFFEKNGLCHGDFQPVFGKDGKNVAVHSLSWNIESTILMICASEDTQDYIQLWTCSNYKWKLKKGWTLAKNHVIDALWDPENPHRLHLLTSDGFYQMYDLTFRITTSNGKTSKDQGFVASIDGCLVGVTPFRKMIVPPPLSAFQVDFKHNVHEVIFAPSQSHDSNRLMVISTDNNIFIVNIAVDVRVPQNQIIQFDDPSIETSNTVVQSCKKILPEESLKGVELTNWCWLEETTLIASTSYPQNALLIFEINGDTLKLRESLTCETHVFSISSSPCGKIAAVQLVNGAVLKCLVDKDQVELLPWLCNGIEVQYPSQCNKVCIIFNPDAKFRKHRILSLSKRNRFYLDNLEVAHGVNSFFVHTHFLLLTTTSHILQAVPIQPLFHEDKTADNFWVTCSTRSVERGSRLVVSISEDTKTVLQMPRGNLEVIHPRALTIGILKDLLDDLKYSEAMTILRQQRINLNIIVDHNPDLFFKNMELFVAQITDKQRICLFLADLQNEDCTCTMYKSMYGDRPVYNWPQGNKIDSVCQAISKVMSSNLEDNFFPFISCTVKGSKMKPEAALEEINKMKCHNPHLSDEGLNFLLLLVDVQTLFDASLGLYDFDLVLTVAKKSQKDPKEYLQFLNELKRYPEDYRKYKIDLHLKKYESALKNLAACGETFLEETLQLIKDQRLYPQAMKIFHPDSKTFKEVCKIYGDYLLTKKYFEDSALVFEQGKHLKDSLEAWKSAGQADACLSIAHELNYTPGEMANLIRSLVQQLVDGRKYLEASNLLIEYLDDVEESAVTLLGGQLWRQAFRLITKYSRFDLLETHYKPKIQETYEQLIETIESNHKEVSKQVSRLQVVHETKQKLANGLLDEVDLNLEDVDLYSDISAAASSHIKIGTKSNAASLQTRASTQRSKSSKNRRKHEKKKFSTKEGSAFEDVGLVASLHDLISKTYKLSNDVGSLVRILSSNRKDCEARTLQKNYENLLEFCFNSETKIWLDSAPVEDEGSNLRFGPGATIQDIIDNKATVKTPIVNLSLLDPPVRYPPPRPADTWKLIILSN